jgi:hypothetical protein
MKMTRGVLVPFLAAGLLTLGTGDALAQGGGASQTGTINGRVADNSGAVLPGVTVTISGPSLMGTQNTVTNEQGVYRFPAVPPGTYAITYELPGFNTLRREGIAITLGFTATVNVELGVAALQETVTVPAPVGAAVRPHADRQRARQLQLRLLDAEHDDHPGGADRHQTDGQREHLRRPGREGALVRAHAPAGIRRPVQPDEQPCDRDPELGHRLQLPETHQRDRAARDADRIPVRVVTTEMLQAQ